MRIRVEEMNEPLLEFRLKRRLPEGGTVPYPLVGEPEVEMYIKPAKALPDTDISVVKYTKTDGNIEIIDTGGDPDDDYSVITVQLTTDVTLVPVTRYFHIDVLPGGRRETVQTGELIVENI